MKGSALGLVSLCVSGSIFISIVALADSKGATTSPLPGSSNTTAPAFSSPDVFMTPDFLLVNPKNSGMLMVPLKSLMGTKLQWSVQRSDTMLGGLSGLQVIVINDTNRPLIVDGDNIKATVGNTNYLCVSVAELQASILPSQTTAAKLHRTVSRIVPAAVTVGLEPTIKDVIISKRPVLQRYGTDENRREAEATRFGKRILWPHEKTQGIVYFKTCDSLTGAKIEIPVSMLFDPQDKALVTVNAP